MCKTVLGTHSAVAQLGTCLMRMVYRYQQRRLFAVMDVLLVTNCKPNCTFDLEQKLL